MSEVVQDLILGSSSSGNTGSGMTVTVVPPKTITIPVTIGPTDGGNLALPVGVAMTADVEPSGPTGTFSPSFFSAGTTTPIIVLYTVGAGFTPGTRPGPPGLPQGSLDRRQQAQSPNRQIPPLVWGVLLLPFAAKLRRAGKRFARGTALLLVLVASAAAMLGLNGCNSSSGFFGQAPQTYTITITATAGNLSRSTTVTLIVE